MRPMDKVIEAILNIAPEDLGFDLSTFTRELLDAAYGWSWAVFEMRVDHELKMRNILVHHLGVYKGSKYIIGDIKQEIWAIFEGDLDYKKYLKEF